MTDSQTQGVATSFIKTETPVQTLFWSTFLSGNLDALAGCVVYFIMLGLNPIQVLQFIAAGIHGPAAFNGGLLIAFAGLVYHFIIAFVAAYVFYLAYPRIPLLQKNIIATGLIYGTAIWAFMNLVVLPNSAIPPAPFNAVKAALEIVWHSVLVGLPIALITDRYYSTKKFVTI